MTELLRGGELLKSQFRILRFLRNDSHADVYVAEDLLQPTTCVHIHVFLSETWGNWRTYQRRKEQRMRNSHDFRACFKHKGQKVVVVHAPARCESRFRIRKYDIEFPSLDGSGG